VTFELSSDGLKDLHRDPRNQVDVPIEVSCISSPLGLFPSFSTHIRITIVTKNGDRFDVWVLRTSSSQKRTADTTHHRVSSELTGLGRPLFVLGE